MSTDIDALPTAVPALPADIAQAIEGKDNSTASTLLAIYRTQLAVRRTGLAGMRTHLANERTHLAYLRTAIALISFGITLNRFSVFLQQQGTMPSGESVRHMLRDAGNVGIGMVLLGLALVLWSLFRYWRVNRDIESGEFREIKGSVLTYTLLVIFLGGLSAVWLLTS